MEFDRSRVYTALNADLVKPGSKVFVADDLDSLRRIVENNVQYPETLSKINSDHYGYRFDIDDVDFQLCYLVSEPNKPRRMTNRELAKWLAQGNGLWKGVTSTVSASYSYILDDEGVPDSIMIRGWDETEWREPVIQEEE